jgi:hypothetical protein
MVSSKRDMANGTPAREWYEPGQWVRHPDRPDWGEGQVQSVVGPRVTVNFEHAGKVLVNVSVVRLQIVSPA